MMDLISLFKGLITRMQDAETFHEKKIFVDVKLNLIKHIKLYWYTLTTNACEDTLKYSIPQIIQF